MNIESIQRLRELYADSWMYPKQAIDCMFILISTSEQIEELKKTRAYFADCWMYPKEAIDEMCEIISPRRSDLDALRVEFVNCWMYPKEAIDEMIMRIGSALPRSADVTDGVAVITNGADNAAIIKLKATIELSQSGTGNPSPENIRTISGWDEMTISNDSAPGEHNLEVTIEFPLEAGNVYGGELTVNGDGSGTLISNWEYCVFSELSWQIDSSGRFTALLPTAPGGGGTARTINGVFSCYLCLHNKETYDATWNNVGYFDATRVRIHDTRFTTVEEFLEEVGNQSFAYEISTPQSYTLSGLEVMKTVSGVNNIYVDTGDILELDYYANLLN